MPIVTLSLKYLRSWNRLMLLANFSPNFSPPPYCTISCFMSGVRSEVIAFATSTRCRIAVILCGALFILQLMHTGLCVALVVMVKRENNDTNSSTTSNEIAAGRTVDWSPYAQGLVLSALSWGRLFTPLGGYFVDRFDSKWLVMTSVFLASIATMFIPMSAINMGFELVVLLRIVVGIADAIVQPCICRMVTTWFPWSERNIALCLITCGRQVGTIVVYPLAGVLCSGTLLGGWPAVFYVTSFLSIGWIVMWLCYGATSPERHRFVCEAERNMIASQRFCPVNLTDGHQKIPWRAMLSSTVVWADILAILCQEYPLAFVYVFLPSYMHNVWRMNVETLGFLSCVPMLGFFLVKLIASTLADIILRHKFNRTIVAKSFNTVGSIGLGVFLVVISTYDCSHWVMAYVFLVLAVSFAGLHTPGCISALLTAVPCCAGTVGGLSFFVISAGSLVNPVATKAIVQTGNVSEWQLVFFIVGAIALSPVLFFNMFGSAEVQSWAVQPTLPPSSEPKPPLAIIIG